MVKFGYICIPVGGHLYNSLLLPQGRTCSCWWRWYLDNTAPAHEETGAVSFYMPPYEKWKWNWGMCLLLNVPCVWIHQKHETISQIAGWLGKFGYTGPLAGYAPNQPWVWRQFGLSTAGTLKNTNSKYILRMGVCAHVFIDHTYLCWGLCLQQSFQGPPQQKHLPQPSPHRSFWMAPKGACS